MVIGLRQILQAGSWNLNSIKSEATEKERKVLSSLNHKHGGISSFE
jgi:hypothetical protein